jgi:hypothetical protein
MRSEQQDIGSKVPHRHSDELWRPVIQGAAK